VPDLKRPCALAIAALLCGGAGGGQATASPRYRFVRPPLLLFAKDGSAYDFDVYVHLDRALPRTKAGPRASILIAGSGSDFRPIMLSASPACYTTEEYTGDAPPPAALRAPHDGQPVRISLRVKGRTVAETTVRAAKVPRSLLFDKQRLAAKVCTIGCPRVK
jgi:hypothetical protein